MKHQNCVIIKQCNSACHEPGMHKFDFSVELLTIFGLVATNVSRFWCGLRQSDWSSQIQCSVP